VSLVDSAFEVTSTNPTLYNVAFKLKIRTGLVRVAFMSVSSYYSRACIIDGEMTLCKPDFLNVSIHPFVAAAK